MAKLRNYSARTLLSSTMENAVRKLTCCLLLSCIPGMIGHQLHAAELMQIISKNTPLHEEISCIVAQYDSGELIYHINPSQKITLPQCKRFADAPQKVYSLSKDVTVLLYRDKVSILDHMTGNISKEYNMQHVAPLLDIYGSPPNTFYVVTSNKKNDQRFAMLNTHTDVIQHVTDFPCKKRNEIDLTTHQIVELNASNISIVDLSCNRSSRLLWHLAGAISFDFVLGNYVHGHIGNLIGISRKYIKNYNFLKILYDLHLQYVISQDLDLTDNRGFRVMKEDLWNRPPHKSNYNFRDYAYNITYWWDKHPIAFSIKDGQIESMHERLIEDMRKRLCNLHNGRRISSFVTHIFAGDSYLIMLACDFNNTGDITPCLFMYPRITKTKGEPAPRRGVLPYLLGGASMALGCLSAYRWYRNALPREMILSAGGAVASGLAAFKLYKSQSSRGES